MPEDATRAAQRVLGSLAEPYGALNGQCGVTASIGISFFPTDGDSAADLVRAADRAMYVAKSSGRNTFSAYTAERPRIGSKFELNEQLHCALEHMEFELYYQPEYDLRTGEVRCAEALLRWKRGGRRVLAPGEFLPLLEASGDIQSAGAWVIQTACRDLGKWRAGAHPLKRVSVNISGCQLETDELLGVIEEALSRERVPAYALEIEVSECDVFERPPRVRALLERIRALGVRIAVDDFGTGRASLTGLYEVPFDTMKIDPSFVHNLEDSEKCQMVTSSMICLGQQLGIEVVAEGVETRAQGDILLGYGCDVAQGYFYRSPAPAGQFERESLGGDHPRGATRWEL